MICLSYILVYHNMYIHHTLYMLSIHAHMLHITYTRLTSPAAPSGPVQVVDGVQREVEHDDVVYLGDVDAAGCYVLYMCIYGTI